MENLKVRITKHEPLMLCKCEGNGVRPIRQIYQKALLIQLDQLAINLKPAHQLTALLCSRQRSTIIE